MTNSKDKKDLLQWHPAFYAGLQVELKDDASNLIFENEHQLGTKPKAMDILVIKRRKELPVHKNIGRIFRRYNIIEYKSPVDYLSIDDFYKVYGYACFYKSDSSLEDQIPIDEITISLMCSHYPRKLFLYLELNCGYQIQKIEDGIYYIIGDRFPIQIVCLNQLSENENLWLKCLTSRLDKVETAEHLLKEYKNHINNRLYQSVMNMIVRTNENKFKEVEDMCEALDKIYLERHGKELEAAIQARVQAGIQAGMETRIQDAMKKGLLEGERKGFIKSQQVEEQFTKLIEVLFQNNRQEDVLKASKDKNYRQKLLEEFKL